MNADSRQIFRELKIGTAAPTDEQLRQVKHYFVGTKSIDDYYNASMFEQEVLQLLEESPSAIHILSGGSMMYIDAVCNGIDDIPTIRDDIREEMKRRYREEGLDALCEDLKRMDPSNPMYDRLKLTSDRIDGIAGDTRKVSTLPSPLGRVLKHNVLPNGLELTRVSVQFGVIGIVYEEERDANGMLVQKELPEGMTADELRLQNAPLGIIYLSDYAWNNVVNMEPRAKLRLERLTAFAKPFMPEGVRPCPNLQFTLDELNTLSNYETNLNDYIRTNLIKWLMGGGVSDDAWAAFQKDLQGKCNISAIQKVYQDAYDRFLNQ